MIEVHRSEDRGATRIGWLDSRHSFSFGSYRDPAKLGFRGLRVINEDRIAAGSGFGSHPHRDMEILTYPISGALAHRDSEGHESTLSRGDVQRMSAGRGIVHSEHNASKEDELWLMQIWIEPSELGIPAGYEEKHFDIASEKGLQRLASSEPEAGELMLHADASVHAGRIGRGDAIDLALEPGRYGWLQIVDGAVRVAGHELAAGDALAFDEAGALRIEAAEDAELLFFDLA